MQILQLQTDMAGNQGWVLIGVVTIDQNTVTEYLQNLATDGHSYMAQIVSGNNSIVLSTVI